MSTEVAHAGAAVCTTAMAPWVHMPLAGMSEFLCVRMQGEWPVLAPRPVRTPSAGCDVSVEQSVATGFAFVNAGRDARLGSNRAGRGKRQGACGRGMASDVQALVTRTMCHVPETCSASGSIK